MIKMLLITGCRACGLVFLSLCLSLCAPREEALPNLPTSATEALSYRLFPGDVIRVDVFDVQALSGEFRLDENGHIVLPLIGDINAANLTAADLAATLSHRLSEKYLKDPDVAVRVMQYRRIFVLGEVTTPGAYAYSAGMTTLSAVAVAGGFSHRAEPGDIVVTRSGQRFRAGKLADVQPGDIIEIGERLF